MAVPAALSIDRNDDDDNTDEDSEQACVVHGLCCCYTALTDECGCRFHQDILCLRSRVNLECCCCCCGGEPRRPLILGVTCCAPMMQPESVCKIGLGCCEQELLRHPRVMCGAASHQHCVKSVVAVSPHRDYCGDRHHRLVLAYSFVQCLPRLVCCARPPDCPVLDAMKKRKKANYTPVVASSEEAAAAECMERGGGYNVVVPPLRTAHVLSVVKDSSNNTVFELDK
jgi:hypothetical protein